MRAQNPRPIVHSLWIGTLSKLEMLTIRSFISHGFDFHLWVYETPSTTLPPAVTIRDANQVFPANQVFARRFDDPQRRLGRGSVSSPFSDIFRFKLLYLHGGWWTDMDVTCLRPIDIAARYVFRSHSELDVIGNIMKCPPKSHVMRASYLDTTATTDATTLDWLLPNRILSHHVRRLRLLRFRHDTLCNMDLWDEIQGYMTSDVPLRPEWYVFHWCHELWRVNGIDKNQPSIGSTLERLMVLHKV